MIKLRIDAKVTEMEGMIHKVRLQLLDSVLEFFFRFIQLKFENDKGLVSKTFNDHALEASSSTN